MIDKGNLIDLQVSAINKSLGVAILSDGQEVPITNFIDRYGDPCDEQDAVVIVCGPDFDGKWYAADLVEFTGRFQ